MGHGVEPERWFSAVLDALTSATAAERLGDWRIVVGIAAAASTEKDAAELADFSRRAQEAGGGLLTVEIGTVDYRRAHDRLLAAGNEDRVLVIDSGVVVLSSTVTRLLDAIEDDSAGGVRARVVPVADESFERFGCALYSRGSLENAGGFVIFGNDGQGSGLVRSPEAVVAVDKRIGADLPTTHDPAPIERPLLEQVMDFPALGKGQQALTDALTVAAQPLVSVVMRTQLHRPEALRDALVCLAGQTDGRFEVILVAHNANVSAIGNVLADQPEWLRSRARIILAEGGTRSVPINVGIAAATGTHIAFLDDDDLVFAHWIAAFLTAAEQYPRRLLRALTAVQRVGAATWGNGLEGHEDGSELFTPYPSTYDVADHLRVNMTPFMAFAFPRGFFEVFGGADESLEVCEDWDLSLRAALVLGVADIPTVTSIYRRWSTGGDSYSTHGETIWQRDMLLVRGKLDAAPVLLPPGGVSILARYSTMADSETKLAAVYASTSWRITAPVRFVAERAGRITGTISSLFRRSAR
ncbi:glycosyltransferase family 2 protein [Salinibacterium sp. M195]|uniref:glycosyltransferase family 2 protein n=1 Tax=Salinibacterium sp. M195 TaxID=2583374 RepID=UPI001C62E8A6|nr:glycosyltransferase family 2 protein [Salinibacterium sp. M195]